MPYTLKPNKFWVKNPNSSGYLPQNVVTDATTEDQVAALEARAAEIEAAWPADYSDLTDDVSSLKSALSDAHGAPVYTFQPGMIATSGSTVEINNVETSDLTEYVVAPAAEGDVFTISGYGRSTYRLWAFIDESGNNLLMADGNVSATNELITAPENTAYLVMNNRTETHGVCFKGISTERAVSQIDALENALTGYTEPSVDIVAGKLYNVSNKTEYTTADGSYFIYDVPANAIIKQIRVSGTSFNGSMSYYPLITFVDALGATTKFGTKNTTYTNEVLDVPSGTTKIIMNFAIANMHKFELYGIIADDASSEADQENKIYYSLADDDLFVSTRYSATKDFVVELKKKGGNSLVDFGFLYTNANNGDYPKSNLSGITSILSQGSDWHGPFIVRAVNNIDGDNVNSHNWTGGNHQYNNTGTGSTATARCADIKWYIDGAEKTVGSGYCSNVRVTWTNYVQGYNTAKADGTGREILAEYHELLFDGEKWETTVNIVALEDVVFERYYGIQHGGGGGLYTTNRYVGAVNRGAYVANDGSNSGDNKCYKMLSYGTEHEVDMILDPMLDLGTFEHLTGTPSMLSTSYGKSYTNVIADTSATDWLTSYPVSAGDMIALHGWYVFKPTQFA